MAYGGGRFWLVYNGEIYNYVELRAELEAAGHEFVTRSDSEVILAAYDQWGESCLDHFVGMFAFVIYEPGIERLFAARDRFGIKPLYYVNQRNGLAFASEIKQLLSLPNVTARMNIARMYDYLSAGMTDHTQETTFKEVMQLRNGECIAVDLSRFVPGRSLPIRRWYRLPTPGSIKMSEEEAADQFRERLSESVRLHLRSDVSIGSCLSGGLDSSSIVCLIDRQLQSEENASRLYTISACYEQKGVDERPFIEAVADSTKTEPHYVFPRAEDSIALAEKITWHQDEPYASTSIFAQWCVFERASQEKIKVMLDGQGADEQLAGYHTGFGYYYASLLRRARYVTLLRAMCERRRFHGIPFREQMGTIVPRLLPGRLKRFVARKRQTVVDHDWLGSNVFREGAFEPISIDVAMSNEGFGPIRDIGDWCVALTQVTTLKMLLHYEDRNSMAHSVEARVPFLDHRLVELSIGLGSDHKMVGGETKRVLRRAMNGILPEKVCQRRDKLAFGTPEEMWFRGPLRRLIEASVDDTLRRYPDLLNPTGTWELVRDMLNGRRPVDFTLWRIVNVGIWGRIFAVTI
jgi:asparagine synthase (glutamine-hydrolysing)